MKPLTSMFAVFGLLLLLHCSSKPDGSTAYQYSADDSFSQLPDPSALTATSSVAVFASGCFWCTEAVFERVKGVEEVISGYAGGNQPNPTYKQVSAGQTDHAESVIVYYDSTEINYETLLDIFFHSHDPTQLNRQGPDVGKQYRSAIFYKSLYQKQAAERYLANLNNSKDFQKPVVTEIKPLTNFWPAEQYHQDYYKLHPDDPYIRSVSMPKVKKFEKEYRKYLKKEYLGSIDH